MINEIRPRIPHRLNLLLRLPLRPIIPPASPPLPIFIPQQHILQYTAAEEEDGQVGQDDAVTFSVLRRVFGLIDVGADDAVEVAPADDETHRYATLVDAFGVVGDPDYGVGDAGVDAEGWWGDWGVSMGFYLGQEWSSGSSWHVFHG